MTVAKELKEATARIRIILKNQRPNFWRGHLDQEGQQIHTVYEGCLRPYIAMMTYETYEWVTFDLIERINLMLEEQLLPYTAEYINDYQIGLIRDAPLPPLP